MILDIKWMRSNTVIATASADTSIGLTDTQTLQRIATLEGHQGTVKTLAPLDPTVSPSPGLWTLNSLRVGSFS